MKNYKGFLIVLFLVLAVPSINAQKGWEIGGWLGSSFYFGDLNNRLTIHKPGIALGFNVRRNFNTRVSLHHSLSYGRIAADDAASPNTFERNRNLSFKSNIFDLSSVIEFNFFNYYHGSSDEFFTPYIFGGASLLHFNPSAELNGADYSLRDFGTEGQIPGDEYGSFSGSLIAGMGWKWDVSNDYSLNVFVRYHSVFTDYLDDVSQTFPDFTTLEATRGEIAVQLSDRSLVEGIGVPGRQRGNSRDNDAYMMVGISLMKYFGKLECPKISDF